MPSTGVIMVLANPQFQTKFTVIRQKQKVNPYGETKVETEIVPNIRGVLFPEGRNDLQRRAEAEITQKTLTIFTRFALRASAIKANDDSTFQPDIVVWNGTKYLVVELEDYSNYASGWVKARVASTQEQDQAPITKGKENVELVGSGYGIDPYSETPVDGNGFPPAFADPATIPCSEYPPVCEDEE